MIKLCLQLLAAFMDEVEATTAEVDLDDVHTDLGADTTMETRGRYHTW